MAIDTHSRPTSRVAQLWQRLSLAERFAPDRRGRHAPGHGRDRVVGRVEDRRRRHPQHRERHGPLRRERDCAAEPGAAACRGPLDRRRRARSTRCCRPRRSGDALVSFKLWREGGRIVYASNPELTGQVFPPTDELRAAWSGHVVANFDALGDDEDASERATGIPLLEIYSPIREVWSGNVIGVAEFYEEAHDLKSNIFAARLESWLVVGAVTATTAAALFGIVLGGSRTIERQRVALEARVGELATLATQNEALRLRVQRASSRATELNEQYLRRISAELHDGPAQLAGLCGAARRKHRRRGGSGPPGGGGPTDPQLSVRRAARSALDLPRARPARDRRHEPVGAARPRRRRAPATDAGGGRARSRWRSRRRRPCRGRCGSASTASFRRA